MSSNAAGQICRLGRLASFTGVGVGVGVVGLRRSTTSGSNKFPINHLFAAAHRRTLTSNNSWSSASSSSSSSSSSSRSSARHNFSTLLRRPTTVGADSGAAAVTTAAGIATAVVYFSGSTTTTTTTDNISAALCEGGKAVSYDELFSHTHLTRDECRARIMLFQRRYPAGLTAKDLAFELGIQDEEVVASLMSAIDTDGNGRIDVREWALFLNHGESIDAGAVFDIWDVDGDGQLQKGELVKVLNCLIANGSIPIEHLRKGSLLRMKRELKTSSDLAGEILQKFDADKDGVISRDEFKEVCVFIEWLLSKPELRKTPKFSKMRTSI